MKTIIKVFNIYKFDELTDEQQQKAIEKYYDINVDHEWDEYIIDELKNLGVECNGFDIDRGSYCELSFVFSAYEVAQNIINSHGEQCDTYQAAERFMKNHDPLFSDYMNEESEHYESEEYEDKLLECESEFLQELSEDYLSMLRSEYEYLTSEEAIKETLICNEYDFTEDGRIY